MKFFKKDKKNVASYLYLNTLTPYFFEDLSLKNLSFCFFNNNTCLYSVLLLKSKYLNFLLFYSLNTKNQFMAKNLKIFVQSVLKNGSFLKIYNNILSSFFQFFQLFKLNSSFFFSSNYLYFNFIKSYLIGNNNFFININFCLWWLVNFLDINFWIICASNLKDKSSSDKIIDKYEIKIKTPSNFLVKYKMTFKLLYLESLSNNNNKFNKRLYSILTDVFFNYKLSLLYKKKIIIYKKLFE